MARDIPAPLLARMRSGTTSLCRLMEITRKDGRVLRLTDCTEDVTFEGHPYYSDPGFTCSAVFSSSIGGAAQGVEVELVMDEDLLAEKDVYGRTFEGQPCTITVVDYLNVSDGGCVLSRGPVGRIRYNEKSSAKFEMTPLINSQTLIARDVYSQTCRASLGDTKCRFPIEAYKVLFTVVDVLDDLAFTVDTLAGRADNYFGWGQLQFNSGRNNGWAVDVRDTKQTAKEVRLWYPLPFAIEVGDTGYIWPGCDKLPTTCREKFGNLLNFRGEWLAPQWTATGQ
jgi:uncharacterized phage protein (TIGR02218 family)